jgi:hypothetical protein
MQNLQLAFQLEHLGAGGLLLCTKNFPGASFRADAKPVRIHRMATILNAGQATCYVNQNKFLENDKTLFYGFEYLLMRHPLLYSKSRSE